MVISQEELIKTVSNCLDDFYKRRIQKLSSLDLRKTLRRKNPYLFKAIGMGDASEIVESLLVAFTSSSDEGIFGDAFFEPLAKAVSSGSVSPAEGVDITLEDDKRYMAIAVKSGPSVFNAQSKKRQNEEFESLRRRLMKLQKHFDAVVGYCYGNTNFKPSSKSAFRQLAGQAFWEELTGDEDFYLRIIDAMQKKPVEHKPVYDEEWMKAKNRFVKEFTEEYCMKDGSIDWEKITRLNSGKKKPKGQK